MRLQLPSLCALALLLLAACATPPPPTQVPYDRTWPEWNKLLVKYVRAGGVDYAAVAADRAQLNAALNEFQAVRPETFAAWGEPDRLAFLVNLHNAAVLRRITREWPVASMAATRLLGSPLAVRDVPALGREWSLRELQDEILGETYLEARALFLLNWGERACAPLPGVAITGLNLPDLLERQCRRVLADPRYLEYDRANQRVQVTPLLERYEALIDRDFTALSIFLRQYLPPDEAKLMRARPPRIRFKPWDATLNLAP